MIILMIALRTGKSCMRRCTRSTQAMWVPPNFTTAGACTRQISAGLRRQPHPQSSKGKFTWERKLKLTSSGYALPMVIRAVCSSRRKRGDDENHLSVVVGLGHYFVGVVSSWIRRGEGAECGKERKVLLLACPLRASAYSGLRR